MITEAMVMTAGLGTRLKPFSDITPKALLPMMGLPLVQYTVDSLENFGVQSIVANYHHLPNKMIEGLKGVERKSSELILSDESQLLLGSGGGLVKAAQFIKSDRFLWANGDVLCDVHWEMLSDCHMRLRRQWGVQLTLAVFLKSPPGEKYREIIFNPHTQLITGLGEKKEGCPFFIGAGVIEKEVLTSLGPPSPSEFVPTILEPAIRNGKAGVFLASGIWCDIGSPLLWLNTHMELMSRLEIGNFPSRASRLWRSRIEKQNLRRGENQWITKGSPQSSRMMNWILPYYWDGRGISKSQIPENLGPHAVVYGAGKASLFPQKLQSGIGYNDIWNDIK